MAITLKTLYSATLGTSAADLYPTATIASKNALVKNIILTNKTGTAATANILLNVASTYYQLSPKDISIPAYSQVVLDSEITLDVSAATPNKIRGIAGTASAIDCVINGLERDI